MDTSDYITAWIIYIIAAVPLCIIFWRFFKKRLVRELAYLFEGFLLAIVFTPWYVLADQEILAPAMIIFVMDSVTVSSEEGIRALIPLIMVMLLVIIVTIVLSIVYRVKKRKRGRAERDSTARDRSTRGAQRKVSKPVVKAKAKQQKEQNQVQKKETGQVQGKEKEEPQDNAQEQVQKKAQQHELDIK